MNVHDASWLKQLSIGSHLEISDKYERWCIGIVEDMEDVGKEMRISYFGWSNKWTEWIDTLSDDINRIAPLNTNIAPVIFCKPPEVIDYRFKDQWTCCISKEFIFNVVIHPSVATTIIIEKYSKLSNQYNRAEIHTHFAHSYIKMASFDENLRELSILLHPGRGLNNKIYVLDVDIDTNKVINESEFTTSAYGGGYFGAFKNKGLIHIAHTFTGTRTLGHAVLNSGSSTASYTGHILDVTLLLTNLFVDGDKNLIYAFDQTSLNIRCINMDGDEWGLTAGEISSPWKISNLDQCSMVYTTNI